MGLNIEGASIGYDERSMNATLQHVENDCINQTKEQLRNRLAQLRDEVNACWVGQSAETFKSNMDHDVQEICKGLDAAFAGLQAEFKKIIAGLAQVDQDLVKKRG